MKEDALYTAYRIFQTVGEVCIDNTNTDIFYMRSLRIEKTGWGMFASKTKYLDIDLVVVGTNDHSIDVNIHTDKGMNIYNTVREELEKKIATIDCTRLIPLEPSVIHC